MATPEQVKRMEELLEIVKVDSDWIDKIFSKADVDDWHEMTEDQILKCIDHCQKKAAKLEKGE
jgi:hypothetical protein